MNEPAEQTSSAGVSEETVWTKIGKQSVEIDLLRDKVVELTQRNAHLEAQVAELTRETEPEPENGKGAKAKARG